ncbi:hypothetical protein BH10BDE1_BH10BDE1_12020 [soil metagenome]
MVSFSKKAVLAASFIAMGTLLTANPAVAQTEMKLESTSESASHRLNLPPGVLISQNDDSYDPFADYSEFDEAVDEEEDLNFFRNGRMLTLGFIGGVRGWTGTLSKIYTSNMSFGLFLCYFFDLRFALQFGFLTSDHTLNVASSTGAFTTIRGNVNMTDITANLKYYFNTQNVTRGLADLNPYILGGLSQIYRTTTVSGETDYGKDSAFAANIGAGLEVPMMRNKLFVGLQAVYQYVMFTDEAKIMVDTNSVSTGVSPAGDSFTVLGVLGVNF